MTSPLLRSRLVWIPLILVLAGGAIALLVWQHQESNRRQRIDHLVEEANDLRVLQKDPSGALLKLKEAHRLGPQDPEVNLEMGIASYQLDRMSDASTYLEEAILRIDPARRPEVSLWLGHVYRRRWVASDDKDSFRRACFAFEDATADEELRAEALYHLGFLVLRLERDRTITPQSELGRAKACLEELVEDFPDSELAEDGRRLLLVVRAAMEGS